MEAVKTPRTLSVVNPHITRQVRCRNRLHVCSAQKLSVNCKPALGMARLQPHFPHTQHQDGIPKVKLTGRTKQTDRSCVLLGGKKVEWDKAEEESLPIKKKKKKNFHQAVPSHTSPHSQSKVGGKREPRMMGQEKST